VDGPVTLVTFPSPPGLPSGWRSTCPARRCTDHIDGLHRANLNGTSQQL
jgi:hypothetical protein